MKKPHDDKVLRAALLVLTGVLAGAAALSRAREPPQTKLLLTATKTVTGEAIGYPGGPAKVTAVILSLEPGQETGWHTHGVPVFGYVLQGEITVDYGLSVTRTYRAGDCLMEAMTVPHNGRNSGTGAARILAVFMGAEGVPLTTPIGGSP